MIESKKLGLGRLFPGRAARWLMVLMLMTDFGGRAASEQDLIRVLQSDAGSVAKAEAAKQLRIVGTARSIPALAGLLLEARVGEAARYALEGMPFPEAGAALRAALVTSSGLRQAGLIDSLGWRGEVEGVPLLVPLVSSADVTIGSAAAVALGRIGGPQALAALETAREHAAHGVRPAVIEGLMQCAEQFLVSGDAQSAAALYQTLAVPSEAEPVRVAAYAGQIRAAGDRALARIVSALEGEDAAAQAAALRLAGEVEDPAATETFAALLPRLPAARQVAVLVLLQARGDPAALPAVVVAARSADAPVRVAALTALGELGDATVVPLLAEAAGSREAAEQAAARQALSLLHRGDVTTALVSHLPTASPAVQSEVTRALSARADKAAVPALLQVAGSDSAVIRRSALLALGGLVDDGHLEALVQLLARAGSAGQRDEIRLVFEALAERLDTGEALSVEPIVRGLAEADLETRAALLHVSAWFVDAQLRAAMLDALRAGEPQVRIAAERALCAARDVALLPNLIALARETGEATLRSLALHGIVRLTTEENAELSPRHRAEALATAYAIATTAVDQRRILSALGRTPQVEALRVAEQAAADPAVAAEAELACLQLAQTLGASEFEVVSGVLGRLALSGASAGTQTRARALLRQLDSGWLYAGPYRQVGKPAQELFDIPFAPELPDAGAIEWRRAPGGTDPNRVGEVELNGVTGGDHCVVYLRTRVLVPVAQSVRFLIGSDDGIKLWVNGELVHANNAVRGLTPDQDRVQGQLREGGNDLLAKITQHTLGCGMTLRITASDGTEIHGLRLDPTVSNR